MKKQNLVIATRFSATKQFSFCTLFEIVSTGKFSRGFIKVILLIFIICCLQTTGCGKETGDNTTSTKPSNPTVNTMDKKPFDFAKVLELYSTYASSYIESHFTSTPNRISRDLFDRFESAEQIEQILKNYDGTNVIKVPLDLKIDVIVDDDYETKGIGIIIDMPFRCYAKPFNADKHIKKVVLCNSTIPYTPSSSGLSYYVKGPNNDLVQVTSYSIFEIARTEFYASTYIKEYPYSTNLRIFYLDSEEVMKDLYKNKKNIKAQIEVKNLSFSRPKTYGFFKLKDLIENDYDTTTLYDKDSSYISNAISDDFRQNPPQKALFAIIKSVTIIDAETKKEIVKLGFDSDCNVPTPLEMNNDLSFQYKPIEDMSQDVIKDYPSLRSVLPENNEEDRVQIYRLLDYVKKLNYRYENADVFDKKKLREKIDEFKDLIFQKEFQHRFRLQTVYIPNDFNKNIARLFIQTDGLFRFDDNVSFDGHNVEKITLCDFRYNTYNLYERRFSCSIVKEIGSYFYTAQKTLAPIKKSGYNGAGVKLHGGSLYYEEDLNTTVIIDIVASIKDMKDIYNNPDDYEAIVVYKNLRQEQLPFWGFFNEDALLILDGNTRLLRALEFTTDKEHIPFYFITQVKKENDPYSTPTVFKAKIKSIYVVNKKTKKIIAKADAKE